MGQLVPDLELKFKRYGRPPRDLERAFAIMRVAKIKTLGNMGASLQHTFRERDTPNADLERTPENTVLAGLDTTDGVVCGRGRNPTLRLWPTIFSGKIDVFPGDRRSRLISSMTSVAPA